MGDQTGIAHLSEHSRQFKLRWWGLAFICISLLTVAMDNTILNNALPSIAKNLTASAADLQWIVDAYVLVFASLLLTMGAAGDRLGRKRLLQTGLALFAVGSLLAAVSTGVVMLTAVRAFMGIGAAMIFPSTLSIITATFPRREVPQAIALWAAVFGLGIGLGPLIGGSLLTVFNWTAVFLVNVPIAIVALIGGAFFLGESKDPSAPPPDVPGVILSVVGLFTLVYAIISAGVDGLTAPNVGVALVIGVVVLGGFVWWERHTATPMLPMQFFQNRSFSIANLVLTLLAFTLTGVSFLNQQYLQSVHNYSALESGVRVLPLAIAVVVTSVASARIAKRFGTKYTVALGTLLAACALALSALEFAPDTSYAILFVIYVMVGAGVGLATSPATASVMVSLPPQKAGVGSAMNDTTRQLGGALGIAVLGTIVNTYYQSGLAKSLPVITGIPTALMHTINSGIQAAHATVAEANLSPLVTQHIITASDAAFLNGLTAAFVLTAVVLLGAFVLVLVALPNQTAQTTIKSVRGETAPEFKGEPAPESV